MVIFPLSLIFIFLAVSNRHMVRLVLDPISPENPSAAIEGPFFIYLFAVLILGILIGGIAVWFDQRKWRQAAHVRSNEAHEWRREAERLSREMRDEISSEQRDSLRISK